MTRINTIPPDLLADQHLFAEYRELPRVFSLARALTPKEVVPEYTLGRGHMTFFYPRTGWLATRHADITEECLRRGYNLTPRPPLKPLPGFDQDWTPDARAVLVSLRRLDLRLRARPGWYRLRGKVAPLTLYSQWLNDPVGVLP